MTTDLTFNISWVQRNTETLDKLADQVEKIGIRLDELDRKKADPKVDVDTTEANAKLDDLKKKIGALDNLNVRQGGLIGLGAAIGSGAAVAAGLLVIPAAFAAIGVAAEKSNPQVQQAFGDMAAAAKQAAALGFAPLVPALTGFATQAKTSLGQVTPQLQLVSAAAAPLLTTIGSGFLKAVQQGIGASVPIVQSLGPVATALGEDFGKAEEGAAGFFANLQPGPAAQGLSILGDDLKEILPPIGSLVSDVIPLGNALLSVLGPALANTANAAHALAPALGAVASVISFLGPGIAAYAPYALAAVGVTKLLTGSFTDFGGAIGKVKSVFQDADGEFDRGKSTLQSLGESLGFTSASANKAKAELAAEALVTAQATKASSEKALAEAEAAFAADQSTKNSVALTAAQGAQALAAKEASAAEETLAATSETASFSMGPLGILIGVVGGALALMGMDASKTAAPVQDLTQQLGELAHAAPGAAAGILASTPGLSDLVDKAGAAHVSVQGLLNAYSSGPTAVTQFAGVLKTQNDVLSETQITTGKYQGSLKDVASEANAFKGVMDALPPSVRAQVQEYNNQITILVQLARSVVGLTTQQQAQQATAAGSAVGQSEAAGIANALGISVNDAATAYQNLASGQAYVMSATAKTSDTLIGQVLAVGTANQTVANYFKQADQVAAQASTSLADAGHSAAQAATAVVDAQHGEAQAALAVTTAREGVATAERAVGDALAGVTTAENNVTKARVAAQQAQVNLTAAEAAAVEQLKALHLQLADQGTSEESARVAVFDATNAAALLGVTTANAQQVADEQVTSINEAQVKAAIALVAAQNTLNDTLNTGANLRTQVSAADQAGVAGNSQVVSAQQALANAQDQVVGSEQALVKAHQAVTDAQANVLKAEQGVKDALYNEQKAHQAVTDALYNREKAIQAVATAQAALSTAQDNDSHSMDIHSAAGQRNLAMLKQIAEQLYANEGPQQAGNDLVNNAATLFGTSTTAAATYLKQLGLIPQNFKFGVTGVANVDLSALKSGVATTFSAVNKFLGFAEGGFFAGAGGPREDANLVRVSNGEYIVNAASTARHLPLLEAINSTPGFADGGKVTDNLLQSAALGAAYQAAFNVKTVMGFPAGPSLPAYSAPAAGAAAAAAAAFGGGPIAYIPSAGVAQWVPMILATLGMLGQSPSWVGTVERRMNQESGGNPNAINLWDSNAKAGDPSRGLMQTIMSTFLAYRNPALSANIYDPEANIYAGENYAIHRYGSLAGMDRPGGYWKGGPVRLRPPKVLDTGGTLDPGLQLVYNGTGRDERVRTGAQEDGLLAELRGLRRDLKNYPTVNINNPALSVDAVASEVIRRLEFHGR